MLCEICKIREANIIYTEVIGGVTTEHHYCAQCAKDLDFGPYSAIFDMDLPLGRFLSGLLSIAGSEDQDDNAAPQITCPTCGTTYQEFIDNSLFGCQDCYGVFDLLINDKIRQLQGSVIHKGKKPGRLARIVPSSSVMVPGEEADMALPPEEAAKAYEARLKDALKNEDYETAAECRDMIRQIRGEMS